MKKTAIIILVAMAAYSCTNKTENNSNGTTMENELDSLSYSLGVNIATNMKSQGLDEVNSASMAKGIDDVLKSADLTIPLEEANQIVQSHFQKMHEAKSVEQIKPGKDYLEANKSKEGVVELPSGLQYRIMKEGNGPKPTLSDTVRTHYHGTTIDGKVFDSSVERGESITFPVTGVIKGWTEALQLMPVGSKWELVIPYNLAYGDRAQGPKIPAYSTLIFEVELLGIE